MAERDTRLEEALRKAAAAGDTVAAQRFATAIRDRRADEGQQAPPTTPGLAPEPSAPVEDVDPLAGIPTEVDGNALSPELRQSVFDAQQIEDPKEKILAQARNAAQAVKDSPGLLDQFMSGPFGATLRGFNTMVGGDFLAAGAQVLGGKLEGKELSFGDELAARREFRRSLGEPFPVSTLTGEGLGSIALLSGGGGAAKVLAEGTKLAAPLATLTSLRTGTLAQRGAKLVGGGAAGGAATEALAGRDPVTGAKIGAVAGPVGIGIMKTLGGAKTAISNMLADPGAKGIKALAKKLGESAEEIAQRFFEFETVMGTKPSIADIANPQAAAELRDIIVQSSRATTIAREAGEVATQRRAGDVAEAIGEPRVTTTATAQTAARTRQANKQFAEADEDLIEFTPREVQDLLSDRTLKGALPPSLRGRLDDILNDVPEGEAATLTGLDVNDIRIALRGKVGKGQAQIFKELANEIEEVARPQSKAFGRAIDEFARRSRTIEGVEAGRKGVTARTGEFEAAAEAAAPEVGAGLRTGVRSELTDVARESATRATNLSRALAEDSGLVQRLKSILKPDEVERLQRIGRVQARSAENIGVLSPRARATEQAEALSVVNDAISATVAAAGDTGGAFKASVFKKGLSRFRGLTDRVIQNMARDAFDPAKTQQVIAALRKAQVPEGEILDLFATAAVGGTGTTLVTGE